MRNFRLVRDVDVTGISGTGIVAEGVEFSDLTAVIHWISGEYKTTTVHPDGVKSVLAIHGHGGTTRLVWDVDGDSAVAFPNVPVGSVPRVEVVRGEFEGQTAIPLKMTEVSRDGSGAVEYIVEPA